MDLLRNRAFSRPALPSVLTTVLFLSRARALATRNLFSAGLSAARARGERRAFSFWPADSPTICRG